MDRSRARSSKRVPSSARRVKELTISATNLVLVRKGLAESAAGKTAYHGSFKRFATPTKRSPK